MKTQKSTELLMVTAFENRGNFTKKLLVINEVFVATDIVL